MAVFQLLSCDVAIGGDILNVVARHAFNPVTYPEMLILKFIHGQSAITDIYDVGHVEREDADEMQRLQETYGYKVVRENMFPGAGVRLPGGDNAFRPRAGRVVPAGIPGIPDLPAPPVAAADAPDAALASAPAPAQVALPSDPASMVVPDAPPNYAAAAAAGGYVPSDVDVTAAAASPVAALAAPAAEGKRRSPTAVAE